MLTGESRSQVDAIWNAFWSGGISNSMEVLEQITCILFIRAWITQTLKKNKALTLGRPVEVRVGMKQGTGPSNSLSSVGKFQFGAYTNVQVGGLPVTGEWASRTICRRQNTRTNLLSKARLPTE